MVISLYRIKQYVSSCHTFGEWFNRFIWGARLRMGMIRKQNESLTSTLVVAVCRYEVIQKELENIVRFMLMSFGVGLRGEEVPLGQWGAC